MRTSLFLLLLMLFCLGQQPLQAQSRGDGEKVPFNGMLLDIAEHPIRGARVYITPNFYTTTDKKGRFGLTNVQPTDTIHVRYHRVVYDIPVAGRKSIRIHLGDQLMADEDEELVNWGYGYVKKRESLEVSSGISGEELRRTGATNLLEALRGRVPGLNIGASSGRPGEDPSVVHIRGLQSIYGSSTPLYLVDGIEVQSLEYVNLYLVDRVEVLKDASIYGARGANGAILVTLRKGID